MDKIVDLSLQKIENKLVEDIEKEFQYGSDEESIYESFQHDSKGMPHPVKKSYNLGAESKDARN